MLELQAANSAPAAVRLQAALWAPRCASQPIDPPPPPDPPAATASPAPPAANGQSDKGTANGNGAKSPGVQLSLLQPQLEPHQALTPVAQLTLDYAALWAEHAAAGGEGGGGGEGAWCAGWVRLGRAAVPYSVRLLPGTLRRAPHQLHFVTANREDALRQREVRVRNEFPVGVHVTRLELAPSAARYWELESLAPLELAPGADALLARVRLRAAALAPGAPESLAERLQLASNVTDYELPLLLYSGRLRLVSLPSNVLHYSFVSEISDYSNIFRSTFTFLSEQISASRLHCNINKTQTPLYTFHSLFIIYTFFF